VRSGRLALPVSAGTFGYAGVRGYDWSSRTSSTIASGATTPSAYSLDFNATGVYPSYGPWERWLAFPLRCLSTVLGM